MNATGDDDRLRILRVSSDTYPEVTGGLGVHVHLMSEQQAASGHDVTVVTSDHGEHELPRRERRDGYAVHRHKAFLKPSGNSICPGIAATVLDVSDQYDIIHAHSHLFFSTNIVAALSYLDDTPLVITNHGIRSQEAPDWLQRLYLPTVARFTLNAADRVLCYTGTDRRRLRELGVSAPVSVINNGVDCSRFRPMSVDENSSQILYVGRLIEGKGIGVLLRAFAELVSAVPDTSLVIVGDGMKREWFESHAAREGVASKVTFTGTVPNDRLPRLYNESAVFALPSFNEGFPRTVLEAMACGTPVVTTNLPQLRSVVADVGRTVPANEPEALADAIYELLADDTLRRQLGETARRRASNRYSWKTTVEETTAEFYSLLDRDRPKTQPIYE